MARRHHKGHKQSAATRTKISRALKGKHHKRRKPSTRHHRHLSAAQRAKISRALKGKHHKHKGHRLSAATRAKIAAALKGKKHPHRKTRHRVAGTRHHRGMTRGRPAYGKGATRFHRARRQVEHARRHHARRQLLRAHRHSVRHQRTRNYRVRGANPRRRRR